MDATQRAFLDDVIQTPNLPSPGATAMEIRTALDRGAPISEVVKIVGRDPGLAASVLSYVNCAAMGLPEPVLRLDEAIMRIGSGLVYYLSFSNEMARKYKGQASSHFDYSGFWHHSVATASAMHTLAQRKRGPLPSSEAFVLGLLSHIGWLCLAETRPELFAEPGDVQARIPLRIEEISGHYLTHVGVPSAVVTCLLDQADPRHASVGAVLAESHRIASALAPFNLEPAEELPEPLDDELRADWQAWKNLMLAA
ncbi:MAG TPA: HDOD domain-containing protein [Rhodocyclaceae bacterium]